MDLTFMKSAVDIFNSQHCPRSQTKYLELVNIAKPNRSDATSEKPLNIKYT